MKRIAAAGRPSDGPRPYGYRYAAGELVVVESESAIVRRIFNELASGVSLSEIARRLYREAVPTLRGGPWRQSTVSGILRNPVYAGRIRYDGEVFAGKYAPLIDEQTWQRVQDVLETRPRKGGRPRAGVHLSAAACCAAMRRGHGSEDQRRL